MVFIFVVPATFVLFSHFALPSTLFMVEEDKVCGQCPPSERFTQFALFLLELNHCRRLSVYLSLVALAAFAYVLYFVPRLWGLPSSWHSVLLRCV